MSDLVSRLRDMNAGQFPVHAELLGVEAAYHIEQLQRENERLRARMLRMSADCAIGPDDHPPEKVKA